MTENKYLTVTDLNYYITQKFKNDPYLHKVFLQVNYPIFAIGVIRISIFIKR